MHISVTFTTTIAVAKLHFAEQFRNFFLHIQQQGCLSVLFLLLL